MFFEKSGGLQLGFFNHLSAQKEILHFVSTREGGVSRGAYASLNLGLTSGDHEQHVLENRRRLAVALGIQQHQLVFPGQTHSSHVREVTPENMDDLSETDALIVSRPGVCISVLTADCVPILLFDPEKRVAAAIHAGWRGTVGLITAKTVMAMRERFRVDPRNILAAIGPSISPLVYEVGEEVIEKAGDVFGKDRNVILEASGGRRCFDLWRANALQLLDAGVKEEAIENAGRCVFTEQALFFSARRLTIHSGRFASGIMIK